MAWIQSLSDEQAASLAYGWDFWARPDQHEPEGNYLVWLICAGRGYGKTRTATETVCEWARENRYKRIALIGSTAADVRDVMVEGESGIMSCSPPWFMPVYQPSKRRLVWPNGAKAYCYSAEEPERLRGPQHDAAWGDEIAAWKYPETYDQLMFGLRLGSNPRCIVSTTPRPVRIMRELFAEAGKSVRVTRGSTYDNLHNLAKPFADRIVKKYEGTKLGDQELKGLMLDRVEGALWQREMYDREGFRVAKLPDLRKLCVAIDPATTSGEDANHTGITVSGLGANDDFYVMRGQNVHDKPHVWATQAIALYHEYEADAIVVETNQGGDMVKATIHAVDPKVNVVEVRATRGKRTRAEPIASLYEQNKVHHYGYLPELEEQLTVWDPLSGCDSPDLLDSLVWGMTYLLDLLPTKTRRLSVGNASPRRAKE